MTTNTTIWEGAPWEELPALTGEVEADVCVIGLGGSGLACAGELLALGQRVVGLDEGAVAAGAAGKNGGFLAAGTAHFYHDAVAALGRERARRLYLRTLAEMDRMSAEMPEAVVRRGILRLAASPEEAEHCRLQIEAMRADGLPVEPYTGPEGSGLVTLADGAFDPLLRCRTLARRLAAAGAPLFERSPALSIAGDEVITPRGRVRCQAVIVAVDGRLPRVLPETAGRVRTVRLQMLACAPTREVTIPRPTHRRWGHEYWQQLPDGGIALGGFSDHDRTDEPTDESEPSAEVQRELTRFLRVELGVTAPITHRWAAPAGYVASRTRLPLVEEVRRGVWATGGYSGMGNLVGAVCGRGLARLVVRGDAELLSEIRDGG
jgi:glycine/D-amino acid oxidase-like deaminating enzyme